MTRLEGTNARVDRLAVGAEDAAAPNPLRGMKLYHGTTASRARKILREGLRPRGAGKGNYSPHLASHRGCVYLSTVYGPAYACRAVPRLGPLAVVEIDAGGLRADRLRPDEDFMLQCILPPSLAAVSAERGVAVLREMREGMDEHRAFWRASLDSLGTVAYQGMIPREAITRGAFFDPRENAAMAYVMMDASLTVLAHMICGSQFAAWNRWMFDGPQAVSPNDLDPWLRAVEAQDCLEIPEDIEGLVRQRRSELQAVLDRWNVRVEARRLMMRNTKNCLCPPRQHENRSKAMTEQEMLQYRQEHFAVEIRDADWSKGTLSLSVTLNGDQWTTLSLRPDEMRQVYDAIGAYLAAQGTEE